MSYLTAGMLILIGIAGYVLAQYSEVNRKLPTVSDIEPFLDQHPIVRRNIRAMLIFSGVFFVFGLLQLKYKLFPKDGREIALEIVRFLSGGLFLIAIFLRMSISYIRFPQPKRYPARASIFEVMQRVASVGWFPSGHGRFSTALFIAQIGVIVLGGYLIMLSA